MATGTFYPAAQGDDGECRSNETEFYNTYAGLHIGNASTIGEYVFFRFVNVTISPGATISSAYVRLYCQADSSNNTVYTNIYAHDPAYGDTAPSNASEVVNAHLTTNFEPWDSIGSWTDGTQYNSPDITDIIQEVIDSGSWSSGDAIIIQIRDDGSSNAAQRTASSWDQASQTELPELHITYTLPPVEFSGSIIAASQTGAINLAGAEVSAALSDSAGLTDLISASGGSQEISTPADSAAMSDSISVTSEQYDSIADITGLSDSIDALNTSAPISDQIGLSDWINGGLETQHELSDSAGLTDSIDCLNWSEFLRDNQFDYVIRYFCTLTGAADDTTDLEIPIQQFQARKRDGEATYLSVNAPGFDYAEQIADRSNGQLIIEMAYYVGSAEQLREEILRVDLENIRTDQGPKNRSITLSGHRTESFGNQISTLTDPIYAYTSEGIRRFRFAIPDPFINPGDTLRVGDDEFRVGYINYIVSNRYRQMEVTEAS